MNIRQNTGTIVAAAFVIAIMTMLGSVGCSDSDGNGGADTTDVDTCHFFPESWTWGEPLIVIQRANTGYNFPAANPSNPDEFSYFRYIQDLGITELRKHNLQTGADVLLCNTVPAVSPGWSGNGKIYFDGGGIVYVADAVSGDLTTLNVPGEIYQPCVGRNNNRMICDYRPSGSFYIAVLTLDGQVTDSLGNEIQSYAWVNDTALAIFKIDKTYKVLSYPSLQEIKTGSMDFTPYLVQYYGDTRFITYRAGDLYFFDYMTGQLTPIIENCGDRYSYATFAITADKSKIISVRTHNEAVDTTSWQPVYSFEHELVAVTLPAGKLQYITNLP